MHSDPVGFPFLSLIGCINFSVSSSSRSIHISWSWILFLISLRRVIFRLIFRKNPIECSLCELNLLCEINALFFTKGSRMFDMQFLDSCLSSPSGLDDSILWNTYTLELSLSLWISLKIVVYVSCVDGNCSIVSICIPWNVTNLRVGSSSFSASKMFWWAFETLNSEVLFSGRKWNVTGVVILSLFITAAFATSIALWVTSTPFISLFG